MCMKYHIQVYTAMQTEGTETDGVRTHVQYTTYSHLFSFKQCQEVGHHWQ